MTKFVEFFCPEHGYATLAHPLSRVEHWCGKECAPRGKTVREHVNAYLAARRARSKRNRELPDSLTRTNRGTKAQRAKLGLGG